MDFGYNKEEFHHLHYLHQSIFCAQSWPKMSGGSICFKEQNLHQKQFTIPPPAVYFYSSIFYLFELRTFLISYWVTSIRVDTNTKFFPSNNLLIEGSIILSLILVMHSNVMMNIWNRHFVRDLSNCFSLFNWKGWVSYGSSFLLIYSKVVIL